MSASIPLGLAFGGRVRGEKAGAAAKVHPAFSGSFENEQRDEQNRPRIEFPGWRGILASVDPSITSRVAIVRAAGLALSRDPRP